MVNKIPEISVVVPSHNDERHIEECLDSLLAQTLRPAEIVVCDDASGDRTLAVVRDWQRRHPGISLLLVAHETHVGIPRNFNSGLLAASGEYVSMLAADDYWKPCKLEREYRAITEQGVRWAYSRVELQFDDREGSAARREFPGTRGACDGDIFGNVLHREVSPRCFLVERKALLEVGLFDESIGMYEDWDLKLRLAKACPVAHVAESNVIYRQHGGGEHHAPMYRHMAEIGKVLRKCAALVSDSDASLRRSILEKHWPEQAMSDERDRAARETALASLVLPYEPVSIKPDGEGLIFLVSLPRSGSTMLQRVLAGHPDIHTTAEPWLMLNPLYALKDTGVTADYDAGVGRQALSEFLGELPGGEESYYDAVRQMGRTLYGRAARMSGKSRFLDKTPRYFYILPELVRTYPKARFIVLLRNPLAILASVLNTWFHKDIQAFENSAHYKDMVEGPQLLAEAVEAAGDNLVVARYEDIIEKPETELRRLCGFLQVPFFHPMLSYGNRPAPSGSLGDPQKVNEQSAPVGAYADAWKRSFDTDELHAYALSYSDRLGSGVFEKLGYPVAALVDQLVKPCEALSEAGLLNAEGEAAFNRGELQDAEQKFLAAHNIDAGNVEVCNNLVVLNWQQGNSQQALNYLEKALQLDGKDRNVVINGGQILAAYGCVNEAAGLYAAYLADHADDAEVSALLDQLEKESVAGAPRTDAVNTRDNGAVPRADFTLPGMADAAPKISIVIPSYNQGRYLETTIRSVLDQQYPNLELIVMDGGSTDNSAEIIRKYADRISYWQSQADDGQYWAINEGFRRSSGDIMAWINSDDKLHTNCLNTMASIFSLRPDVEWVTGTPNIMNESGFITWICDPPPVFSHRNYLRKQYDFPSFIQQEGTFWRRSLWDKAGATLQTDLQMAGDLELWARFFRHAPLYTATVCTGCFRQQESQKTASAMDLYREEAERVLDREIALFEAAGRPPVAPVDPLVVETEGHGDDQDDSSLNDKLVRAIAAALPDSRPVPQSCSAIPGSRRSAGRSNAMHGARQEPLVSAIVSTYNSEKYLRACLDDLEAQSLAERLEIIVVDSGSTQAEGEIVREYQRRYTNIRYLRTESRETVYSAWNRGVKMARGKYITNANTDDRHRVDALERMVKVLEEDSDTVLVYADVAVTQEENASLEDARLTGRFCWPEFDARHLFSVCYVGPQPMWRCDLHDKYGYFDPRLRVAGDYDFWLRVAVHEKFRHLPEVLGLYLSSAASIEHAMAGIGAQESENARDRNWPAEWGQRPPLSEGYLVPAGATGEASDGQPLVSVIMATKNRRDLLPGALASVTRQTYRNWEIILVNDGGEDVADIVADSGMGSRVQYLRNPQSVGQAGARNRALRAATGDIITILDDDDMYLPAHLQTVVDGLHDGESWFVYTDADMVQEKLSDGARHEVNRSEPYRHDAWSRQQLHIDNYIPINTWAFRRACLDRVSGFDDSLSCCEDWDFLLRLAQHFDFRHIARTTVEVRHRVDAVDNVTRQRLDETEAVYRVIYSRYDDYSDDTVRRGRRKAIEELRAKQDSLGETRSSPGLAVAGNRQPGADGGDSEALQLERAKQRFVARVTDRGYHCPAVHLFVVVDAHNMAALAETLDALGGQIYTGWGLTVVSTQESPGGGIDELPMIEWIQAADTRTALTQAMGASQGEWLALLDPGDRLSPLALSSVVEYSNLHPEWRFVYVDESFAGGKGKQVPVHYKPDINIDYLLANPYLGGFCPVRRDAFQAVADNCSRTESIALAVCLRLLGQHGESAVGHIAEVLNQRATSVENLGADGQLIQEYKRAIGAYLQDSAIDADVAGGLLPHTFMLEYRLSGNPAVCVAIYAVGAASSAVQTVLSVLQKTAYTNCTLRVALEAGEVERFADLQDRRLQVDVVSAEVSRAAYLNQVAQEQSCQYLLFLDPGAQVLQDIWLQRLLACCQQPGVGALGLRLVSAEQRIVHGGLVTGVGSFAVGGIAFAGQRMDEPGYMNRAQVPQSVAAVSSACMLVEADLFRQVQGFDSALDVVLFQDVDLCQRLLAAGRRIVWTPYVTMLYSGAELGSYRGEQGIDRVRSDAHTVCSRWLPALARDAAYNRNLGLKQADFTVDRQLPPAWNPETGDQPGFVGAAAGSRGSWQYRVVQPLAGLEKAGVASYVQLPFIDAKRIQLPTPVEIERIQPRALLMHNTLHDDCIDALEKYRRLNRTFIVFGQDDLMFALPPKNPFSKTIYKDIKKRVRRCLALSDRLLVTTEALASGLQGMANDIRVVPNYLDDDIWLNLASKRNTARKPRAGWAGAQQHQGDLEMIEQVVRETAQEVDWVFFGMCPERLRPYVREVHEAVRFENYPERLAALNLDIAIAPLEHNRFNEAKSNLRILEYGALGWPVIASDIEPYQGAPVCLVRNQPRAWINAIRERAGDIESAWKEGDRLREWVLGHWMLAQHSDDWLAALDPASPASVAGLRGKQALA